MALNWWSQTVKNRRSIVSAISLLTLSLAAVITLIYSFFTITYSWVIQDNIFNRLTENEALIIRQKFDVSGEVEKPRSAFMTLHKNWQGLPEYLRLEAQADPERVEFTAISGSTIHIQVLLLGDTPYVLVADMDGFEVSSDYFPNVLRWLMLFSVLFCTLTTFVAFKVGKQLTAPLKELTADIDKLDVSELQRGFANKFPNNEIGFLASTIEQNVLHLQQALQRESNFTKDVSHEIRTPISILKNIVEQSTITPQGHEELKKVSFELEQITETLLALARDESTQTQQIQLAELVEQCLLSHFQLNHSERGQEFEVNTEFSNDITLEGNVNLCSILINNVLSNAVQYASEPNLMICIDNRTLTFSNQVNAQLPEQLTKSGVKGLKSTGIGQGLSLIERICQVSHWSMSTTTKQQVFELKIEFPNS